MTSIDAKGSKGKVKVIFMFIKKRDIHKILSIVKEHEPNAFYTIEDIRYGTEETAVIKHKRKYPTLIRKFK